MKRLQNDMALMLSMLLQPYRTVGLGDIHMSIQLENTYKIRRNGLVTLGDNHIVVNHGFHVFPGEFGFQSSTQRGVVETERLLDILKTNGARPVFERRHDGLGFVFWFDLSTKTTQAYCEFSAVMWTKELPWNAGIAYTFELRANCENLDHEVIIKLQRLDEILHMIAKQCNIPSIMERD